MITSQNKLVWNHEMKLHLCSYVQFIVDKRVAPDREGAADKQCQGEGKLWSQYVITNREEGIVSNHLGYFPRRYP